MDSLPQIKVCPKCKEPFPLTDEFWYKNRSAKNGYQSHCKKCRNALNSSWQKKNPDKVKENVLRWRKANPEKRKENLSNYQKSHPEKHREYKRRYQQLHPEKSRIKYHKRKAQKLGNGGSYTFTELQQLFEDQGHRCFHCDKFISLNNGKTCHIDHWIPLVRGGSNNIENIRLLCPYCNLSKGDRLPWKWHEKYINENPDVINSP